MNADWVEIISKVQAGEMSVEEAAARLEASGLRDRLASGEGEPIEPASEAESAPLPVYQAQESPFEPGLEDIDPDLGWWENAWLILFWIGAGVIVLSAVLMGWAYTGSSRFWMFCSWLPMLLGIFVLVVGWWSRQARWVHVRVNDSDGKRVSISLPLPLGLVSWFLRVFGPLIPSMRDQHMDDLHLVFDALKEAEGPITVEVDDKNGDRVRVYIL